MYLAQVYVQDGHAKEHKKHGQGARFVKMLL
jgi:hypothetical protein